MNIRMEVIQINRVSKSKIVCAIAAVSLTIVLAITGILCFDTIRDEKTNSNIINKAVQIQEKPDEENKNSDDEFVIDWDYLKKENEDIIAWIYIPDTNINYPILKGESNNTYLRRNIYHKYSYKGCIFAEHLNEDPFADFNTIIYGHNLENGTMFSQLKNYRKQSYYDEHKYIYIYTPDGKCTQYLIFSFHRVSESDGAIYNLSYASFEQCKTAFTKKNMIQSDDFDESNVKNVITLSTCDNSRKSQRYVLHACSFNII